MCISKQRILLFFFNWRNSLAGIEPTPPAIPAQCSNQLRYRAQLTSFNGASVAQWSERSPFTSEVAGSILSENFLNVTRAQFSTHVKRVSQHFRA